MLHLDSMSDSHLNSQDYTKFLADTNISTFIEQEYKGFPEQNPPSFTIHFSINTGTSRIQLQNTEVTTLEKTLEIKSNLSPNTI